MTIIQTGFDEEFIEEIDFFLRGDFKNFVGDRLNGEINLDIISIGLDYQLKDSHLGYQWKLKCNDIHQLVYIDLNIIYVLERLDNINDALYPMYGMGHNQYIQISAVKYYKESDREIGNIILSIDIDKNKKLFFPYWEFVDNMKIVLTFLNGPSWLN
jgi:hypothetical protein